MTVLLLIRHGENDYLKKRVFYARLPGVHLNDHGRQQANALAQALSKAPVAAVYSSPLERAVETARPIADAVGLPVHLDDRLLDTDIGEWTGKSWKAIARTSAWRVVQQSPSRFRFPGGESFLEGQMRVVAALDDIITRHRSDDLVVVVGHADPIKLAVAHYLGLLLDHFQRLACDTGSATLLWVESEKTRLIWLNHRPPFDLPDFRKR